jgi:DNA-binding FadR family transcriptional regulator
MSNRKRLYISIFNKLLALIESGEFPVGSKLPAERELAERFKVSRPTIREAIIALEAKEVVSTKASSGVHVLNRHHVTKGFSREVSAFELLEARVLLEGEAAALAAKMISQDELQELELALEKIKREGVEDSSASGADRQFHSIIARATHNQIVEKQISLLWDLQENLDHINKAHRSVCANEDRDTRIADHISIFDSIASGDASAARSAMRGHFSDLLKTMHDATELNTLEEAKLKVLEMRKRFSIKNLST